MHPGILRILDILSEEPFRQVGQEGRKLVHEDRVESPNNMQIQYSYREIGLKDDSSWRRWFTSLQIRAAGSPYETLRPRVSGD